MLQSSIDLDVLGTLGDWPGPSLNPAAYRRKEHRI
jgi:hypothetical protein